jgi:hypothetical protein
VTATAMAVVRNRYLFPKGGRFFFFTINFSLYQGKKEEWEKKGEKDTACDKYGEKAPMQASSHNQETNSTRKNSSRSTS